MEVQMGQFQELRVVKTATIANGTSLSAAVDLTGLTLVGIQMPSAWTAADLTFEASTDDGTYDDVYDGALEYSVSAAASRFIRIAPSDLVSAQYLKVRSGTSGTPVNQLAERAITLIARPI
jgi:hypothetical protein